VNFHHKKNGVTLLWGRICSVQCAVMPTVSFPDASAIAKYFFSKHRLSILSKTNTLWEAQKEGTLRLVVTASQRYYTKSSGLERGRPRSTSNALQAISPCAFCNVFACFSTQNLATLKEKVDRRFEELKCYLYRRKTAIKRIAAWENFRLSSNEIATWRSWLHAC